MAAMDLGAVSARAKTTLGQFSMPQKVIISLLAVVGLVAVGAFARWVTAPSYGVLMAGLAADDAAAVTGQLDADGVPYRLEGGGTTVLVPTSSLQTERLAVAAAGLPNGSTKGYELLDTVGMTSSSFQQQIAYQRAVEGELAKTLGQLKEVKSATVHLSLPKQELYTDKATPARASVLLDTRSSMPGGSVDAVQRLVAAAVPDLAPEGVTVSDTKGALLSSDGGSGAGAEAERAIEDSATARADSMLTSVLGPGKAVVRVNAEMDLATRSTESETYDPTKSAVLSRDNSVEKYDSKGSATGPGGIVSVPDPVAATGATGADGTSVYNKDGTKEQFGVTRTVDKSSITPGGVKRLTVAVALDQAANIPQADVEAMVANAVGIDKARGDTISVAFTPFPAAAKDAAAAAAAAAPGRDMVQTATLGVSGLVLLVVLVALLRAVRRGTTSEIPLSELELAPLGALDGPAGARAIEAGPETQVLELVDSRPDEVGALIRSWLAEPSGAER